MIEKIPNDNMSMLEMSPWDFDQSSAGWRKIQSTGDFLGAARLIREYIAKNEEKILNQPSSEKNIGIGVMYFHIGQLLACEGEAHWPEAVEALEKSFQGGGLSWNAYVSATIGFLEGNEERIDEAIRLTEATGEGDEGNNLDTIKNLKKALQTGIRDYFKAVFDPLFDK